jgi:hypothetical protein
MRHITLIIAVVALAIAAPAIAGKGGNPNGGNGNGGNAGGGGGPTAPSSSCSVSPGSVAVGVSYVVSASGLPTETAINLWVTDPAGNTVGRPLGSTPDGSFNLNEASSSSGTWTYAFSGPTKQNTTVYASCSVTAS